MSNIHNMMTARRPISMEPSNSKKQWNPEESLLSKSLGNPSLSHATSFKRSTSEISSISYCGYLLKRSNYPHVDSDTALELLSLKPLETNDDDGNGRHVANSASLNPRVQIVTEIMFSGADECDARETPSQLPLHLQHHQRDKEEICVARSPMEQSLDHIASFFGFGTSPPDDEKEETVAEGLLVQANQSVERPVIVSPVTPSRGINCGSRSAPISVVKSSTDADVPNNNNTTTTGPCDDDVLSFFHRGDSAPTAMRRASVTETRTDDGPMADFVDPKDGHIWRAKYCVLEDGILYFYRNAHDAESQEAKAERSKCLNHEEMSGTPEDLSKSPTPRRRLILNNTSLKHDATHVIYEKRVFLDRVGAVCSNHEYGECAFELRAVENDDNDQNEMSVENALIKEADDKLILRSRNPEEMKEWLFQFHRYLASLMKNIIEKMTDVPPIGDIHHPSCAINNATTNKLVIPPQAMVHDLRMAHLCSSRVFANQQPLSHGHGQSSLRRKRGVGTKGSPAASASPPPLTSRKGKYIAPNLRNKKQTEGTKSVGYYVSPHQSRANPPELKDERAEAVFHDSTGASTYDHNDRDAVFEMLIDEPSSVDEPMRPLTPFMLGGCADPRVVVGSIVDPLFKSRSASKLGKVHTEDYGAHGGGDERTSDLNNDASLKWEIGAVSKCGARDSNEDSYLVAPNLVRGFQSLPSVDRDSSELPLWVESGNHRPGLFCVFDGHNGDHAARFAAEKLPYFLMKESREENRVGADADATEEILHDAITSLDEAFCRLCTEDGRDWDSGATALIALVAHECLVLANLGDCRAVVCRSMDTSDAMVLELHGKDGWMKLDLDAEENPNAASFSCFFREVTDIHKPSRPDELERIRKANGWITTETEIPVSQLQRIDFCDEDVVAILKRCTYSDDKCSSSVPQRMMEISRVCGDLAVSRALGDREYKAAFNDSPVSSEISSDEMATSSNFDWHSPMLFLAYPDDHSKRFSGDLVSAVPEMHRLKLATKGVFDEFLLLACDGLWDVIDPDNAIRVMRGLLYEKKWEAKRAAARLAELAIHLGSSDNVTVIVIRFFKETS